MNQPEARQKRPISASICNLDKFPILPWKSAKSPNLTGIVKDLGLVVVKANKGEGW